MTNGKEAMMGARKLPWRVLTAICAVVALGAFPAGADALSAASVVGRSFASAGIADAAPSLRGYPIALSAGSSGGVWYGGATEGSGRPEFVDRIDYITPAGAFLDFAFPPELGGYWPEALAPAANGYEWFLARREGDPVPILGEVSPLGQITVRHLQVPPGSEVRGLAMGSATATCGWPTPASNASLASARS